MSRAKDNNSQPSSIDDTAFDALVYRVLSATGRIVPRTEEEVAQVEAEIDEWDVELPEGLSRPPTGPSPVDDADAEPVLEKPFLTTSENLARAARCGAEIPPEIQQRMEADRQRAESEADGNG
ncbi:MAG: hypothetical protein J5J06_09535 [Phycisphaerae bacterium]|nr:hypothetical protein [Phycisphaerae bacterium]